MQDSERVGRYQLLELFGSGPNGTVSRAKVFGVAGFERQFAVKRFQPELTASPSAAQSLSAAARSYGSLEHPRIARMSEFGVAQGQTFTAVELVVGLDAGRLVAEAKLGGTGIAAGGALALVSQAARAVGYAHGRGLSHLGLAPTNVIVTADGDVKVTDFGILAATITARPVDTPRLAQRIGYLAPEQLAGEATSAATDVFVLGVIAYELVTGQRAYYADSPQSLAQAILAGPPSEPPLPRPIVRVLSRCLARSQFERFPDARAFADALDAALRVAPVPGTRKDIGAQVKTAIERHAAMNEGQLSGVVAINVSSFRAPEVNTPPARDSNEEVSTTNFVRPDVPVNRPAPLVGPQSNAPRAPASQPIAPTPAPRAPISPANVAGSPASTIPDLQKPITTVPGLVVPPPIPVPPGISSPQPPPIPPPIPTHTILGVQAAKRPQVPAVIAQIKKPGAPPIPSLTRGGPLVPPGGISSGGPVPPGGMSPSGLAGALARAPGGPGSAPVAPNAFTRSPANASDPNAAVTSTGLDINDLERRAELDNGVHDAVTLDGNQHDGLGGDTAFEIGAYDPAASTAQTLEAPIEARFGAPRSAQDPTTQRPIPAEVHARGGLQPFATKPGSAAVPTDTSPSIEVIREPDPDHQDPESIGFGHTTLEKPGRTAPSTSPPFARELPTGQMPPQLVRDLKRLSADTDRAEVHEDPLVEMSLEVHGGDQFDVPSIAPTIARPMTPASGFGSPPASGFGSPPATNDSGSGSAAASLDAGTAGSFAASSASSSAPSRPPTPRPPTPRPTPPREVAGQRMPSPSPPSLVAMGAPGGRPPPSGAYGAGLAGPGGPPVSTVPNLAPPPPAPYNQGPSFSLPSRPRPGSSKRWLLIAGLLLVVGAGVAVFVWQMKIAGEDDTVASNDKGSNKGSNRGSSSGSGSGLSATSGSNTSGSAMSGSAMSGSAMSGSVMSGSAMSGSAMSGSATSGSNTSGSATSGSNTSGSGTSGSGTSKPSGSGASGSGMSGTSGSGTSGSGAGSAGSGSGKPNGSGKETPQPTGSSDALQIASTPAGARVFIDGADQGVTPVKLPGSADRHSMALLLAGHDLYVAEVDGHGSFQIPMKPITPPGGPAGIKVLKCTKDRYYVFVDGKPTGMVCPTERIECDVGSHTVEVYDVVTETRRKWDIKVTDTRLSYRVRVE